VGVIRGTHGQISGSGPTHPPLAPPLKGGEIKEGSSGAEGQELEGGFLIQAHGPRAEPELPPPRARRAGVGVKRIEVQTCFLEGCRHKSCC
jgi:hypothetical protein